MIPAFNDDGYLPPGVYAATLEEIEARFGRGTEIRQVQMQSLWWLAGLVRRLGVARFIVNGSFVSETAEPNDVDCVLLPGPGFPLDPAALAELADGLPFINAELLEEPAFGTMTGQFFGFDRNGVPKGVIEVRP